MNWTARFRNISVMCPSPKAHVLLQYYKIGRERMACSGEVNDDELGACMWVTEIPTVSEDESPARMDRVPHVLP